MPEDAPVVSPGVGVGGPGVPGGPGGAGGSAAEELTGLSAAQLQDAMEEVLLGGDATLTRVEVAQRAGMPLEQAQQLWHALGFAHVDDDERAFGDADVEAMRQALELIESGVLDQDSQVALVRTWGRSFARLADWQTTLLAGVAADSGDPARRLEQLALETVPTVDRLQSYIWRRHLLSAAGRLLARPTGDSVEQAVGFVDIVGYTSQSRKLDDAELVALVEHFEATASGVVTDHGARVIKTIGDAVLFAGDDPVEAARTAQTLVTRHHEDERFPEVRAGVAFGPVVSRLGDVYGPTVNIASRLTTLARPGTVLVDSVLNERLEEHDPDGVEFRMRRVRRTSVKGYHKLEPWRIKAPREPKERKEPRERKDSKER